MRNQFILLFFILTAVSFAQKNDPAKELKTNATEKVFKYTNPITRDSILSMRDYMINKVGDKWYATGTSNPIWDTDQIRVLSF